VTGSGRSGTGYIAQILGAAGLRCGHEALFGPRTRSVPDFERWDGDASWLAAPFVTDLPSGTVVLHQLRDPPEVVASWYGLRFLAPNGPYSLRRLSGPARLVWHELKTRVQRARGENIFVARDYELFVARHEPEVLEGDTTLDRCMRYWVAWNERVERAADVRHLRYHRYRIEDLADEWPVILELLHLPRDRPLPAASADANTRARHDAAGLRELSECPVFDRFRALAHHYGYEIAGGGVFNT
jgi:hypothetical protein